ncbi:MAG: tyrosine-type recombinase/integrase [Alphaproteobacteria bacterium]
MPLSAIQVKSAKPREKQYKLFDEKGLFLLVKPAGAKYWRLKYRFGGKEKLYAIGVYPEMSLLEARERRDAARKLLRDGIDPSVEKKLEKLKRHISPENTFEGVAREWHKKKYDTWTERHAGYIMNRLELDIFPSLGSFPIANITSAQLLAVLRKVENRGAFDIAKRLRQTTGQIFRYAIATGRAEQDITFALRDALKTMRPENYKHLPISELPAFLKALEAYEGYAPTKIAFLLLIITMVRTNEIIGARWEEVDIEKKEWRIPKERMKMREAHIVPLTDYAVSLFKQVQLFSHSSEFVFPSIRNMKQHMSNNALLVARKSFGYKDKTTVHGFRALASTILNEKGFRPDVIERQLAHAERNKVRAAYNHAQYLPERREMMQWWSDYVENEGESSSALLRSAFG